MANPISAVLFDLDGTLVDTAPDLLRALNTLRREYGFDELSLSAIRPQISLGSKPLIKQLLGIEENHPQFLHLRARFFDLYQHHIADATQFFPGIEEVLMHLETNHIPWGIVTNKLKRHTIELLKILKIDHRPACVVCGDTLSTYKPHPEPILHACELIKKMPANCLYVGDSATDVIASKAAGTQSLVALYGYIGNEDPLAWEADGYVRDPLEILTWLQ